MKLSNTEKFVLKSLLEKAESTSSEIARQRGITSQAVGKIRKQLLVKGYIKSQETKLDYEKFGINLHAIALIKLHPSVYQKFSQELVNKALQPPNVVRAYNVPQTEVTHIMIYAFRNINEYDTYFHKLQEELGEYVEIRDTYVFSSKSVVKSSQRDVFLEILKQDCVNRNV